MIPSNETFSFSFCTADSAMLEEETDSMSTEWNFPGGPSLSLCWCWLKFASNLIILLISEAATDWASSSGNSRSAHLEEISFHVIFSGVLNLISFRSLDDYGCWPESSRSVTCLSSPVLFYSGASPNVLMTKSSLSMLLVFRKYRSSLRLPQICGHSCWVERPVKGRGRRWESDGSNTMSGCSWLTIQS